jgi:colicin import membrane protein
MRKAIAISAGLHTAVLLWATLSLSGHALDATPPDALPVDMISEKDFSQMTKGAKDAPKPVEKPKPLVEKKAEPKPEIEDIKPKITEKQEVKAASTRPPEPPKPPEPQKPEKQEAKAEEKKPEPKPQEKAPDAIAKELKKEDDKKIKEAKAEPRPLPPKKPPLRKQPEFNPDKIAALLDQREPQRHAATGNELNANASLGRANGLAAQLSQNEIDALRERIKQCWQPPLGAEDAQDLQVVFHVMFNQNGTVLRGPDVVEGAPSALGPIFAESARRAILQCQPYTMLRREHYAQWRDMEMVFNLRDMFR